MSTSADIAEMPPQVRSTDDAYRLGDPIADQHGTLTSADGTGLFYRYWPAEAWNGRVVIVLHGIGYHSGPYKVIADALNPRGITVYGLDARGHGLSCGPRGYTGSIAEVAQDVAAIVDFVKRQQPHAKVFLLGDSMGCNYALNFAKQSSAQLAGLILLAPAFWLDTSQLFDIDAALLMPYFLFGHRKPVIDLVGRRLDESSRDPKWIAARRADPLAYKKANFGYLLDIQRLIFGWRRKIAPRVRVPILMMKGGKDRVVSHRDCETFQRISASPDKRFEVFPNVPHTTLWDAQTPEILRVVGEWTLAQ
ncbi:MAG: alpha/beta fold hydrolase [Terriglobales bacterium]|jgi:alpha-beta hydrolase superfamily lysophospholipase